MTDVYQLSDSLMREAQTWIQKFPAGRQASAVLPILTLVQEEEGYLSEAMMNAVGDLLDMPHIAVYEVATFYSMFDLKPCGKNKIGVCTNISCMLNGSEAIVEHFKKRLNIKMNESTKDGQFHLRELECLGACGGAPVAKINRTYHEKLTPEKIDEILVSLGGESC